MVHEIGESSLQMLLDKGGISEGDIYVGMAEGNLPSILCLQEPRTGRMGNAYNGSCASPSNEGGESLLRSESHCNWNDASLNYVQISNDRRSCWESLQEWHLQQVGGLDDGKVRERRFDEDGQLSTSNVARLFEVSCRCLGGFRYDRRCEEGRRVEDDFRSWSCCRGIRRYRFQKRPTMWRS